MNIVYIIGGAALSIFGIWLTVGQAKVFLSQKKENPKTYYKGLGVGIICIIIGIVVIVRYAGY